jgi:hypothetical protein
MLLKTGLRLQQAATSGPLAKIGDQLRAHPEDRLMTTLENIEDKAFYQGKAFAHV